MNLGALCSSIQVAAQIRVYDVRVAGVQQAMDRAHRIVRPAIAPVGVLLRCQIRFEDRIEHQQRRRLYHPIDDRRHGGFILHLAQRAFEYLVVYAFFVNDLRDRTAPAF